MIARTDVDELLSHFLFQIQTTELEDPSQAITLIDFTAINVVTSIRRSLEKPDSEELSETAVRERLFAVDLIADAAKQMVQAPSEPTRMKVYYTLLDLISKPD